MQNMQFVVCRASENTKKFKLAFVIHFSPTHGPIRGIIWQNKNLKESQRDMLKFYSRTEARF